jgi:hypothetical protein
MHLFNMATLFVVLTLVGVEFSVSAFREPCRVAARTRIAIEDAKPFCPRAWKGDAGLVLGLYAVSRYPDLALLAHAWARNPAYSGCDLDSYFGGIDLCLGSTR